MIITFPSNPHVGDEFLADNGSTYIWMGDRWSGTYAVFMGIAEPVIDGEDSSPFNTLLDNTLDGSVQHIIGAN
jgi:hypothetical protein